MKRIKTYATLAGLVITGTAVAILPMTVSSAAVACAPAWSASTVYVNGNTASYAAHNYTAKWWTQDENPAAHSGQWDVWADPEEPDEQKRGTAYAMREPIQAACELLAADCRPDFRYDPSEDD